MKKITIFLLLIGFSCSSIKNRTKTSNVYKLTFSVEDSPEVISLLSNLGESFADSSDINSSPDSIKMFVTQILNKNIQETAKYPNEITLEITKDGWFKQRFIKNKHTDCHKHFFKNDSVYVYDSNKVYIIHKFKLAPSNCLCKINIDKSKTKNIHGYKCFYVKAEEICGKTNSKVTLTTTYEMYLTDKIHIPMHAILENDCKLPGYFPLEIKCYLDNKYYYEYKLNRME
ncbi:MAG: hypothetical protein IPJ43_13380 [Saprospiraceae bacterium]|nr:hypothetical protein [Saprospiraceae bacterium]